MTQWLKTFKTKTIIKPMLCAVVLGFVALCSVTSAQTSWTNGYSTITTEEPTVQTTSEKKDLSKFWSRLANRLGEVFSEIVGLVTNGLKQWGLQELNSGPTSFGDTQVQEVNLITTSATQPSFVDVETIPERYFVDTLANHGIVKGTDDKFFPDNYTRLGDFIKIVVDTYRTKVGYDIDSNAGLTNRSYFMGGVVPVSLEKAVNTAYELGFLTDIINPATTKLAPHVDAGADFDVFLTTNIIDQVLTNIGDKFPGLVIKPAYQTGRSTMGLSDLYVKRGVMTKYVVQAFDLAPLGNDSVASYSIPKSYFSDIAGNPYRNAIKTLADLGIVNSQLPKFYPDNYLRNYEFTVMLVNALLVSDNKKFNPASYQDSATSFVDLDAKASYMPWVKYAEDKDLISYLTVTSKGQNFFNPNQAMSKNEIYHILEDVTGIQMNYETANAGQQHMTRGEFASILVQVYQLDKLAFDLKVASTDNSDTENQAQTTEEDTWSGSTNDLSLLLQIKALLAKL